MSLFIGLTTGLSVILAAQDGIDTASHNIANSADIRAGLQDVAIAEAIMDLQVEEVAYQATLRAVRRSLPATLVSFLR